MSRWLDERERRRLVKQGFLLQEQSHTDGLMGVIFDEMKGPLKSFGAVVRDAAKVVGNDIGFLVKVTLGGWLMNGAELRELRKKKQQRRNALLDNIFKNSSPSGLSGDAKLMQFMLSPGAFITGRGMGILAKPFSADFRKEVGSYGFDKAPGIGWLFSEEFNLKSELWNDLTSAKDGEDMKKKLDAMINRYDIKENRAEGGGLNKVALGLTALFMLKEDLELLAEEDEEELEKATDEQMDWLAAAIKEKIDEIVDIPIEDILKMKKGELKAFVGDTPKSIAAISTMASTDDVGAFFKSMEKLVKASGDKGSKIDTNDLKSKFEKMKEMIRNDEESMSKMKAEFEDNNEEPDETKIDQQLNGAVLASFKAQFIQPLKEGFQDTLEKANEEIWDGMTKKEIEAVRKTPKGAQWYELCKEYEDQIMNGISNLKK